MYEAPRAREAPGHVLLRQGRRRRVGNVITMLCLDIIYVWILYITYYIIVTITIVGQYYYLYIVYYVGRGRRVGRGGHRLRAHAAVHRGAHNYSVEDNKY